jgi:hypothetical protein
MKIITSLMIMALVMTQASFSFGSENSKANFSLKSAKSNIQFTAFKTTAKLGVKGWFNSINILSEGKGSSIREAIDQSSFSIPVSSLFTKDAGRDMKIKTFFFGTMEDTLFLSGKVSIESHNSGVLTIKMNNITNQIPFSYTVHEQTFQLKAKMNIDQWFVQSSLSSLNKVCKELHKGPDGVSRTWPDVDLQATFTF